MRYFWCELAIVSAFMITFAVEFNSLTIINIRTMVNYKDLGLVNTRDMFAKAIKSVDIQFLHSTMYGTDAGYHQSCSRKTNLGYFTGVQKVLVSMLTLLCCVTWRSGAVEYAKRIRLYKNLKSFFMDHGNLLKLARLYRLRFLFCNDRRFSSAL